VDVAVAKMLGWMRGHIRKRIIQGTEYGIPEDQLPYLHSLEGPLQEQLLEMRIAARQALEVAAENYTSDDTFYYDLRDKEEAVIRCDELLNKAATYFRDIQDEISKGGLSDLKIDQQATVQTGETHLTLNSIDRWAKGKYGISIIENSNAQESTQKIADKSDEQPDEKRERNGGLSKTKADHLYTTFAFLLEAFSLKFPAYSLNGEINVKATAEFLSKQAVIAGEPMQGQRPESIKDRIEEAMKIKKSKLSGA
jgi:hypothetical protein